MKEPPIPAAGGSKFKRVAQRLAWALGIALWALPAIPVVQHYYGVIVRHRAEKRLRHAGLWPTHTMATNLFAPSARVRGERVVTLLTNQSLPWRLPSTLTVIAPGIAVPVTVSTNVEAWGRAGTQSNGWTFFAEHLATNEEHFAAVGRAIEHAPYDLGFDYSPSGWEAMSWSLRKRDGLWWPVLDGIEGHRSYLRAAALLAVRRGDSAAAVGALEDLMAVNGLLKDQHALFAQESRMRGARSGVDLTWLLLSEKSLDEQQLARLAKLWDDARFIRDAVRSFEMDVAGFHQALESVVKSKHPEPERFFFGEIETNEVKNAFDLKAEEFTRIGATVAWSYLYGEETVAAFAEFAAQTTPAAREIVERHGASEWQAFCKQFREPWKGSSIYKLVRRAPMTLFVVSTVDPEYGTMARAAELETEVALTRVAIAAERYRRRHGHYAESASELIPEFLAEVPRDWQTGERLRYAGCGDTFALYALGWDGRDDSGSVGLNARYTRYFGIWCGKDAVWLRRANQTEIEHWEQERDPKKRKRATSVRSSTIATNGAATNVTGMLRTNFPARQSVLPSAPAQSTN